MTHQRTRAPRRADRILDDSARANPGKRHAEEGRLHLAGDLVRAWIEIERMKPPRGDGRALERGADRPVSGEDDIHLHLGARSSRRASAAVAAYGQNEERKAACSGSHNRLSEKRGKAGRPLRKRWRNAHGYCCPVIVPSGRSTPRVEILDPRPSVGYRHEYSSRPVEPAGRRHHQWNRESAGRGGTLKPSCALEWGSAER